GFCFRLQDMCAHAKTKRREFVVVVETLRRASDVRLTAAISYLGDARQVRVVRSARVPITAKVLADFLSSVGVDRVLTVDLHAEQIQGLFDVPVDNVFGNPILPEALLQPILDTPIGVSPDIGGGVPAW
ncbi:ribose-phosphate pyrophosphokinase-like domain-containing protein, partial [Salmonella enterica]|uniref:ribose-phosphate pyrophosphokinase-like domain-containing protein n=1 Tax=Salmonella enterica TaxID=28901 RepID=UPI00398C2EB2